MNYGGIKEYDIANGPGIRLSLFVSGCRHHCKGCFNAMTWDFNYGEPYTKEVEDDILKKTRTRMLPRTHTLGRRTDGTGKSKMHTSSCKTL